MKKTVAMLEKERKRALIPFFVMCAFIALALALWQFSVPASVMSAVVGVLFNVVCGGRMRKKYVSAYNSVSRGMLLEQTYGGIDFDPSRGFSEKEVASAGIMKPWNGFDSKNGCTCKTGNIAFALADLSLKFPETDEEPPFDGKWTVYRYNLAFRHPVLVRQKGFSAAKVTGNLLSTDIPMQKLHTGNSMFDQSFSVYAGDSRSALSVLTPPVMTELMKLREASGGKLAVAMNGNRLWVVLSDRSEAAEPPMFRKVTANRLSDDLAGRLKLITDFAEALQLEKKIWTASDGMSGAEDA